MEKSELRKLALQKRDALESTGAAAALRDNFLKALDVQQEQIIATYSPIGSEIDVSALNEALWSAEAKLCLPVIQEKNSPLIFCEYDKNTQLTSGYKEILEPADKSNPLTPDIIIVPLVAFDAAKNRLGYGGGFYDRTLQNSNARKIGVAFSEQQLEKIPTGKHDIKLDMIITESIVIA